ncbi:MAG: cation diffusion facilitator family transporter [Deltaproteobacteria bacterium]|nr:cation diffusion facilitator family transporter [Deltaproteobacteria bacterium]
MHLPSAETRQQVERTLKVVLVLNLLVAGTKLLLGLRIRSISMVADGFHSLIDTASNVVGLVGIAMAAQPPDEDHPYGHWKFETLAGLFIGGLLAMTAWEVLRSCFDRLLSGSVPEVSPASLVVMGVTVVINLAVSTYERRKGELLRSDILTADAVHTRSDVYVSLAVIGSLLAAQAGYPQLDLLAALVITGVIAHSAYLILKQNAGRLTDPALYPAEEIEELALTVPGVEGVHKVRTRHGREGGYADLHIQVRADLPIAEAHAIGHRVTDLLRQEYGLHDVITHVEPHDPTGQFADAASPSQKP